MNTQYQANIFSQNHCLEQWEHENLNKLIAQLCTKLEKECTGTVAEVIDKKNRDVVYRFYKERIE